MGAKCCMPIKDDVPMILRKEYKNPNAHYSRSNGCSPSWSFQCDNRTHTENIVDTPTWLSQGQSSLNVSDFRSSENLEIEAISVGSSLSSTVQLPENSKTNFADVLKANISSQKGTKMKENSTSTSVSDPSSSSIIACSRTPASDSLNDVSFRSNILSNAEEYHTLSSENWSTCSYSEAAISPQQSPIPYDIKTCILCLKPLNERCQWDYDILTVAVLSCGHAYHAGCLEKVTPESLKFDPNCPTCYEGRNPKGKAVVIASSSSSLSSSKSRCKISRRAVVDVNVDGNFVLDHDDRGKASVSKVTKQKGSFLKRHFYFGSRTSKMSLEAGSERKKKGLWAHYR